jgi:hypothetical protein
MSILKVVFKLSAILAILCCYGISWGQYSIISGEYRGEPRIGASLSLLVAKPSGKNWTIKGTLKWNGKAHAVSGTLYEATNKVALRAQGFEWKNMDAVMDGMFNPETGRINVTFKAKIENREYIQQTFACKNKNQKAEMETVWLLEEGYPKRCATFTEEMAKGVTVDPKGGTVTWHNIPKHDGSKVEQVIKFTVPKNEYRLGEKLLWSLDASGCARDVTVFEGLHMALGWDGQGWAFAIDWGDSAYGKAVGWNPKWEPIFGPSPKSRVRFVVRKPEDLYEWWYSPVTRPKKPAVKPSDKPVAKPTSTAGTGGTTGKPSGGGTGSATPTSKAPTLRVVSIRGDVQVRKNDTLQWVDFNDALPLKEGDQIATSFDEEIELALPDGATLRMEPNSTIKVGPLLQTGRGRTQAIMDMIHGRVFVRGTSSSPFFAGGDFVLRRNETGVSPRGTAFSVGFDKKEKMMQVHVDEGEVTITNKGEEPIILKAGETWVRKFIN